MEHSGIHLKEIRKNLNLTQQRLAEELGISKQAISKIEVGTNELSTGLILALKERFDINPDYLLTGEGKMFQTKINIKTIDELEKKSENKAQEQLEFFQLNLLNITCSAGGGSINYNEEIIEVIPVPKVIVSNPKNKDMITVSGDSMFPTLQDKELVVIDKSKTEIKDNKIFVICVGDNVLVKRLQISVHGVRIISDNKEYPVETISPDEIKIIGQVVASMKRF